MAASQWLVMGANATIPVGVDPIRDMVSHSARGFHNPVDPVPSGRPALSSAHTGCGPPASAVCYAFDAKNVNTPEAMELLTTRSKS